MENVLRSLADRAEIMALSTAYACAVDRLDEARLLSVFREDATLSGPNFHYEGTGEIKAIIPILKDLFARTWHAVHQVDVHLSGDTAISETYCTARHLYRGEGEQREVLTMIVRYHDDLVRGDDGWKIAHRRQTLEWTETGPAIAI